MTLRRRLYTFLFWGWIACAPIGLSAGLTSGIYYFKAKSVAATVPDPVTGRVVPFNVGIKGRAPHGTVYVTNSYSLGSEIASDILYGWLALVGCQIAVGLVIQRRQRRLKSEKI